MKRSVIFSGLALVALLGMACGSGGGGDDTEEFIANFFQNDVRVDTDLPGAAASQDVRIACARGVLYAVWSDNRNGSRDVYMNRSTDGGETWLATDVRVDTDVADAGDARDPQICVYRDNLYVVWEDGRNGETDVYFSRSTDGGDTWLATDVRLETGDAAGASRSGDPLIACNGDKVVVVWEDDRGGLRDVVSRASTDGGATWTDEVLLATNGLGTSFSDRPRMHRDGDQVVVVWHDNRDGNQDIYTNVSTDGGLTWLGADIRVDTDVAGAGFSFDPEVYAEGANVSVVWADVRNGNVDIYYNRSTDGGLTWGATDVRVDTDPAGQSNSTRPIVRCAGDNVYVAWIDTRSGTSDVFMNRSTDGGVTWQPDDFRLNTEATGLGGADFVQLAVQAENVYVVWEDTRDGSRDVHFNSSSDAGTTWRADDVRLDTDVKGAADSRLPRIDVDGTNVYVAWRDARNGNNDIYTNTSKPE